MAWYGRVRSGSVRPGAIRRSAAPHASARGRQGARTAALTHHGLFGLMPLLPLRMMVVVFTGPLICRAQMTGLFSELALNLQGGAGHIVACGVGLQ